jgi:hypothetical protein
MWLQNLALSQQKSRLMKSTKDPKEVVVEESSGRVFEEGVTGHSRDKERCRLEILQANDSTAARVVVT